MRAAPTSNRRCRRRGRLRRPTVRRGSFSCRRDSVSENHVNSQFPTSNSQLGTWGPASAGPWELGIGSWELTRVGSFWMEAQMRRILLAIVAVAVLGVVAGAQTQGPSTSLGAGQATTDIYFIDTEGGQATLIISPTKGILGARETLLLDAGNLNPPGRDADRIMAAMKDAGLEWIDQLVVTHYHGDHVGGVAALADKL